MLNLAFGQIEILFRRSLRQYPPRPEAKDRRGRVGLKAPIGYLNEPKLRTIVVDP